MRVEPLDTPAPGEEPPAGVSAAVDGAHDPFDKLRRMRDAALEDRERTFLIGGPYDGKIAIRYRRLDAEAYTEALLRSSPVTWERCAQLLIEACVEIFRLDPESGEHVPWLDGRQAEWVDIEADLGIETETARETVLAVFAYNDQALIDHADDVAAWMDGVKGTATAEAVGGR